MDGRENPEGKGLVGRDEHEHRAPAEGDRKASDANVSSEGGAEKTSVKPRAKREAGSSASGSGAATNRNRLPALEVIREEHARDGSPGASQLQLGRIDKLGKKAMLSKKAKKKKKVLPTVVFEESQQVQPLWLNRDEKATQRQPAPGHCLYFRHGVARGLTNLKQQFFIVILLQRKSSSSRRKQIIRAL